MRNLILGKFLRFNPKVVDYVDPKVLDIKTQFQRSLALVRYESYRDCWINLNQRCNIFMNPPVVKWFILEYSSKSKSDGGMIINYYFNNK